MTALCASSPVSARRRPTDKSLPGWRLRGGRFVPQEPVVHVGGLRCAADDHHEEGVRTTESCWSSCRRCSLREAGNRKGSQRRCQRPRSRRANSGNSPLRSWGNRLGRWGCRHSLCRSGGDHPGCSTWATVLARTAAGSIWAIVPARAYRLLRRTAARRPAR